MKALHNDAQTVSPACRIAVYMPGSTSLFSTGAAEAPFSAVNQLLGEEKYQLLWLSHPCQPTDERLRLPGPDILDDFECDLLMIVSHTAPEQPLLTAEKIKLQHLVQKRNVQIIAAHAGPFWLAECDLVTSQPVALHWSLMESFSERFPALIVSDHLYTTKDQVTTCAGQAALLDCLIQWIENREGHELAYAISDLLCLDRIRSADERQRIPAKHAGETQPRLTMAIELMENNIEEPLSTGEIASLVNISRRQLERLFKRYLDTMPARYYLQLRLKKARQLLLTTNTSIVQIGLHCGFSSGAHFSSAYKSYYQITPREERSKKFHPDRV
ncbi:GlxA family transcriptional regulator [Vibrio quintilis]|uniref:HTH-type transcriptional regulator CdhR n=1 Tax=Vibrio quintilis TaxID=1117707 RepID=A0A1M7YWD7_9VIBR|nr:helix-turn-helix domain-containing protein [Vibrio quintilis]SHO56944.1 HTH-type transcriptional regulator CdhR [Vibrio quintilis]